MNKIQNVIIINDFNYVQGGASKVAIDTAKILANENINVYFFSATDNEEAKVNNVKYVTTKQGEALKDSNKFRGMINGIYNIKAEMALAKLLKTLDNKNTIIHVHGWTKALSSSVFNIAFKMKFKVVLTMHDYFSACPNGGYFNYKTNAICKTKPLSWKCIKCNCDSRNYAFKIYRIIRQFVQNNIVKLNKKIKNVIVISEFSKEILKQTLNSQINIEKIENPINMPDLEERITPTNNSYYLYVGRVDKEKGVEIFCKSLTELNRTGIVVGDGSEKEKLEKKYPNIKFEGWKNKKEILDFMRNARAMIFPSRWYETLGLTIIEAQQIGLPVLCSNVCAGIEVADKRIIFNIENINDLKEKIIMLDDDEILESISKDVYDTHKKDYNAEYKNKILKCFEKILNR